MRNLTQKDVDIVVNELKFRKKLSAIVSEKVNRTMLIELIPMACLFAVSIFCGVILTIYR